MLKTERSAALLIRCTAGICLTLVLVAPRSAAAQSRFSGIVVFGTSLSDPGNAFALVGDAGKPPDFTVNALLVPAAPYARGGHHFSNGATWVEQFAASQGLSGSTQPAFLDPAATNYAVGAARAYDDGVNVNLTRQVDTFLERSRDAAAGQQLYVIEMGSNDIRDAFAVYASGGDGGAILSQAIGSIAANVQRLYAAGARDFLVWVAPDVSLTPAIRSLPPAAQSLAAVLTEAFNVNLTATLAQLSAGLPGSSFARLDADALLKAIVASPDSFRLENVASACITPNVAPFTCPHADTFLFWDGIHPTKVGHALLAAAAAQAVQ